MENIPQNKEKVLSRGERIAKRAREGLFDFPEIMGSNTEDDEIRMIIEKIEGLKPENEHGYELYDLLIKWTGYDKGEPERKELAAQIRLKIDEIFLEK